MRFLFFPKRPLSSLVNLLISGKLGDRGTPNPSRMPKIFLAVLLPAIPLAGTADKLLYGVAYYDEYMPLRAVRPRGGQDEVSGINVVRVAESTWSTLKPKEGVVNFSRVV